MLSRTADHLYWMSRQSERAESLARLLDMHYRHSLLPHDSATMDNDWRSTLNALGIMDDYLARYQRFERASAFRYLATDRDNPGSIVSCLWAARENARAVRGAVTSEMWETINTTWLDLRGREARPEDATAGDFLDWVRYRTHLWRGVTIGTMLRDEGFRFTRLGTFLETADATARMVLCRTGCGMGAPGALAPTSDAYAWTLLLRSVAAFEVYRKVYRDTVTPAKVTELLVLRKEMPRSLHRCMEEVDEALQAVANDQSQETERLAGELRAELRFGRLCDILDKGIDTYLRSLITRIGNLGMRISADFLVTGSST
jgi:uncharacterized alpha-E superfamily protein